MGDEFLEEFRQLAFVCPCLPAVQRGVVDEAAQAFQSGREGGGVVAQIGVIVEQVGEPRLLRGADFDARCGAHGLYQGVGQGAGSDFAAFGFDVDDFLWVEALDPVGEAAFKPFLRRLRAVRQAAKDGAFVHGQGFEIERLHASRGQRGKQPRFAAAGRAADHAPLEFCGQGCQQVDDVPSPCLVAARELSGAPADQLEPVRGAHAPHAAAPAVDERPPVFGVVAEMHLQHRSDVSCHQGCAQFSGIERRLRVEQADFVALFVVQNGTIQRAGNMIFREFGGGTDVDDFIEVGTLNKCAGEVERQW